MRADFAAFLNDNDREVLSGFVGELLEADGSGEPGRAAADDDEVKLHRLAFGGLGHRSAPRLVFAARASRGKHLQPVS